MVIVETKFDENVTKALNKASFKKIGVVLAIVSLIFIFFGMMMILDDELYSGIFFVVFGVLYIPIVIGLTKILQKRSNKTLSILNVETTEIFEFDNDYISIKLQKSEDYYSETKAKYSYIFKAVETKDDFILYISNRQAHVVPKSRIVEGSVEELREMLSNNLNEKFKKMK